MWLGIQTKVFNVGNYRRKLHGAQQPHDFFDPANAAGERSRREAAVEALNDMISWFENERGVVALYDATNSTRARREMLLAACAEHDIQVLFIESICQDESLILHNIMDVKLSSPDYKDMDPEKAAEDFRARIVHYEDAYETITEDHLTFIKLINVGSQVIISHIKGYLQSRIVYYLMNLHIAPRNIFFSRHGESLYNVMGKLGGDSELSARGKQYARALPLLISTHLGSTEQLTVWTSTLKRTIATAEQLPYPKLQWKALDELDAGVCDGMTYEEIEQQYPEDFANRDDDKFNYRYRGGESYRDVVVRLEPVIMELERHHNILIVGHQAILRCIYAYFMNYSHEKLPYIKIPLHTLIQLTPRAYMCEEKRYKVDIEAVDTHRPKPKKSKDSTTSAAGSAQSASPNGSAPGSGTGGAPKTTPEKVIAPPSTIITSNPQDGGETTTASIITTCMSTTTFRDDPIRPRSKRASLNNPVAGSSNVTSNGVSMTAVNDEAVAAATKAKEIQDALQEVVATSSSSSTTLPPPSNTEPAETLTQPAAPTMNGTAVQNATASNSSSAAEPLIAPTTSTTSEPPAAIAGPSSSSSSPSPPRTSSPSSSRAATAATSAKMAGIFPARPAGVSTRSNSISSTGSHQTAVESSSSSSYSQAPDSRTSTTAVANGGFRYRPMEDLATPPMSPVPDNFYRSLLNRTASAEGVNSAAAAAVAASVAGLSSSSSSPDAAAAAAHHHHHHHHHHHQSFSAMLAMPPPPTLSHSSHGSPVSGALDTDAADMDGHPTATGEPSSSSSSSSPSGSNLSIRTQGLLATPPALMRLKNDAWQEGPEYERTAGASPRDPLVSPGGRLLPQQDNWHFP
ncbi:Fructose-2,6-bisphosphatase [Actinomortierella ambigua]|nr:Fructose-2,6-bisphosphatase [Actinomortierella ambigua]